MLIIDKIQRGLVATKCLKIVMHLHLSELRLKAVQCFVKPAPLWCCLHQGLIFQRTINIMIPL